MYPERKEGGLDPLLTGSGTVVLVLFQLGRAPVWAASAHKVSCFILIFFHFSALRPSFLRICQNLWHSNSLHLCYTSLFCNFKQAIHPHHLFALFVCLLLQTCTGTAVSSFCCELTAVWQEWPSSLFISFTATMKLRPSLVQPKPCFQQSLEHRRLIVFHLLLMQNTTSRAEGRLVFLWSQWTQSNESPGLSIPWWRVFCMCLCTMCCYTFIVDVLPCPVLWHLLDCVKYQWFYGNLALHSFLKTPCLIFCFSLGNRITMSFQRLSLYCTVSF